jgi:hypothetical protein
MLGDGLDKAAIGAESDASTRAIVDAGSPGYADGVNGVRGVEYMFEPRR